jgi:hypothetical protein
MFEVVPKHCHEVDTLSRSLSRVAITGERPSPHSDLCCVPSGRNLVHRYIGQGATEVCRPFWDDLFINLFENDVYSDISQPKIHYW